MSKQKIICLAWLWSVINSITITAFQLPSIPLSSTKFKSKSTSLFMSKQKNDNQHNTTPTPPTPNNNNNNNNHIISRRSAILTSSSLPFFFFNNNSNNNNANAISLDNPFTPLDRKPINNFQPSPAKRATAYLVDSTIPPTLVPFKAQREAAILKGLGNGSGTPKTPFIEEGLNLNNMMNKGVFGTIDFVKSATSGIVGDGDKGGDKSDGGGGGDDNNDKNVNVNDDTNTDDGKKKKQQGYDATFVFLGLDYNNDSGEDTQLAIDLISDITKPRRGLDTAIALSFVPISLQQALNEYIMSSDNTNQADEDIVKILINDGQVPPNIALNQLPILKYAKSKQLKLIASSPEPLDVQTVRTQGLQNVDPERRGSYVSDAQGFIEWTQQPKNKLYTERSLLKDWTPLDEKETTPGGFFAEKILIHETIATRMANYAFLDGKKGSMVINVSSIPDVRFLGGPNGRIARICKAIKPNTVVDDEAVTTILINPSAEETLSQSRFLRLEIGTAPSNLAYQTKVADYLWFSTIPKVNMLPRLMNG